MALARLKSVAGVTIPDTALCNAAVDLLESSSPGFLCTHCLRTYIFGSLAVRGLGRSVVDEEAAFCGAVLHDLGLVPPYRRDNRFEVDGADAARQFCSKHQVAPERADLVWKAIALHTSPGIATRLADEVALVDGVADGMELANAFDAGGGAVHSITNGLTHCRKTPRPRVRAHYSLWT
jgi:HD superfamily phosphodiesterase